MCRGLTSIRLAAMTLFAAVVVLRPCPTYRLWPRAGRSRLIFLRSAPPPPPPFSATYGPAGVVSLGRREKAHMLATAPNCSQTVPRQIGLSGDGLSFNGPLRVGAWSLGLFRQGLARDRQQWPDLHQRN